MLFHGDLRPRCRRPNRHVGLEDIDMFVARIPDCCSSECGYIECGDQMQGGEYEMIGGFSLPKDRPRCSVPR